MPHIHHISIHSLRVEGDGDHNGNCHIYHDFNPLPPCGGRHPQKGDRPAAKNFNPLPPCGGRHACKHGHLKRHNFNPLPPCGGRRRFDDGRQVFRDISIHSLRVEGDNSWYNIISTRHRFQSTPSVWRETYNTTTFRTCKSTFQSTPSVWRETSLHRLCDLGLIISIHSLRVEGDKNRN